jgi:hypothetical protein
MVAVSPAIARAGKPVEFELKRFAKRSRVVVSVIGSSGNVVLTLTVTTASDGTAKGRFSAPTRGVYSVVASTTSPAASASTRLTVS